MAHPLVFRRYAGSLQAGIKDFDDLLAAVKLPEALWMATACPVTGLICDPRFLELLDGDHNGRIRVEEVREAVALLARMFKDHHGINTGSEVLQLAHLSTEADRVRAAALLLLGRLEVQGNASITLQQVRQHEQVLRDHAIHGDGIVAPGTIGNPRVALLARQIMGAFPERKNRAGLPGVDGEMIRIFRERRQHALLHLQARDTVFAWGPSSLVLARKTDALAPRIDEFFLHCRLVASQPDASGHLRLRGETIDSVVGNLRALHEALSALPLAVIDPKGLLTWDHLHKGPLYDELRAWRDDVAAREGAGEAMSETQWRQIRGRAETILAWQHRSESDPVYALGDSLCAITDAELDALQKLSDDDKALAEEVAALTDLEKLALFQRWMLRFANNFISMPDLYAQERLALFQRGRLILAGRVLSFSVAVPDRAAHSKLAEEGTMFVAYVALQRKDAGEALVEVAVPVTSGTSAGIVTGKRGIFFDHEGKEYDAVVTHVVKQPVSLWEAATQPFGRIGRFIGSKIETLSSEGDKTFDATLQKAVVTGAPPPPPGVPAPAATAGVIAGGGLAFAAIGSSLAFMMAQLKSLTLVDVVNALIALILVVAAPSALVGWLKLRKRNLAIVLEGSGWALNDRLLLTRPLGALFTRRPRRPAGSRVERGDVVTVHDEPDEESEPNVVVWGSLFVTAVIAWQYREWIMTTVRSAF